MPLIDIRASLLDPTDLRGIPMIQDGTAVWCPPSFLPKKSDKPGIVGTGPAVEFLTFAKKAVLRKEIDAIIADPAGATIPTELDRLWVLVSFLVAGAQNDGILKIVPTLLPRLPVEFSIVLLRDLIRCRPQIVQEKGVSDFLKTNKVMLF